MLNITFTKHALVQLRIRAISQAEVRLALISPDKIIKQTNSRYRAIKKIERRYVLVVIFEQGDNKIEIITAFKTSKINKYL